jgi:aspartate/methionine/tyrosine aminotransferase
VASLYQGLGPSSILIHAGAEEAILNLCLALLGKGDRVIVNFPCYQSLSEIPRALGCRVDALRLREESGRWLLDPDELDRLLEKGGTVKLVILNFPHNPTGALPSPGEFARIVESCRKAGAILLVDEVYQYLEHDPGRRLPAACEAYEKGISLNVLSKSAGLAGLRIGWLATAMTEVLDRIAVVKDYNSICASGPSEVLAGVAVRHLPALAEENSRLCLSNLALLRDFFARRQGRLSWTEPEGGSIAFPRLADGEAARWQGAKGPGDAEALALRLVKEAGVLLLPGAYYGFAPAYFRIGYGRANMAEALAKFEAWLDGPGA